MSHRLHAVSSPCAGSAAPARNAGNSFGYQCLQRLRRGSGIVLRKGHRRTFVEREVGRFADRIAFSSV
jgi:hypothetical protein